MQNHSIIFWLETSDFLQHLKFQQYKNKRFSSMQLVLNTWISFFLSHEFITFTYTTLFRLNHSFLNFFFFSQTIFNKYFLSFILEANLLFYLIKYNIFYDLLHLCWSTIEISHWIKFKTTLLQHFEKMKKKMLCNFSSSHKILLALNCWTSSN